MPQRALWAMSLLAAAFADASNHPGLAFYLVLAAIAGGAAVALRAVSDLVEDEGGLLAARAVIAGSALVLVVAGAALRAPFTAEGVVPAASSTALFAAIALLALDALLAPAGRVAREPLLER